MLFAVCTALSITALLLPASLTGSVATTVRETLLAPLVLLQQRAEEGRTSRARFQAAIAERDSAAMLAQEVPALTGENERLRALLGLGRRPDGRRHLAAEVLRQTLPTDGRTLLLSVGEREGARPYLPVITDQGLLGVVASAGRTTSVATTWAHPEFRVSAVTENGEVLGIVAPSANTDPSLAALEFRGVAYRDTVPDGTLVMTAGLGGVYPRGIPVGRVLGVRREELGWERVYRLVPAVNPGTVSHVLLVVTPAPPAPLPRDSAP